MVKEVINDDSNNNCLMRPRYVIDSFKWYTNACDLNAKEYKSTRIPLNSTTDST
jgi:hypothetical protein